MSTIKQLCVPHCAACCTVHIAVTLGQADRQTDRQTTDVERTCDLIKISVPDTFYANSLMDEMADCLLKQLPDVSDVHVIIFFPVAQHPKLGPIPSLRFIGHTQFDTYTHHTQSHTHHTHNHTHTHTTHNHTHTQSHTYTPHTITHTRASTHTHNHSRAHTHKNTQSHTPHRHTHTHT